MESSLELRRLCKAKWWSPALTKEHIQLTSIVAVLLMDLLLMVEPLFKEQEKNQCSTRASFILGFQDLFSLIESPWSFKWALFMQIIDLLEHLLYLPSMIFKKDCNYIWLSHQELAFNTTDVLLEEENKWQEMKLKRQNSVKWLLRKPFPKLLKFWLNVKMKLKIKSKNLS